MTIDDTTTTDQDDAVAAAIEQARAKERAAAATVVAHYRWLAEWFEMHPEIAASAHGSTLYIPIQVFAKSDDEWAHLITNLGTFWKGELGDMLTATVKSPATTKAALQVLLDRSSKSQQCERVCVGSRTEKQEITQVVGYEDVTVPVYEWRCPDSWLAFGGRPEAAS